ncbi:NADPH-dependent F420 reductase [Microbacterium dextranolyticum]|uniref:Semialdehyde dehydrogenase NAD-binding domain-containing protein n=1 Tax=Microbacterium dextranolyticum TaxID=36806 RepID=A0A9W6HPP0_9MICO|nr:NAD(P)-binding domain-containing protein [Microbacterium dextranolyticum]MBM7462499.1 putative dinucleotide-binding enzyme [Microbacterium dextranolyticum]GLJ96358.1 hypothetical protein GCM10017591_24210 [Microbacterium dextranolyticum]
MVTDSNHIARAGTVGIVGAGRIGRALAQLLESNGREVLLGSRRAGEGSDVTVSLADAASADIVVLALPHAAIEENLAMLAAIAPGTVVIDVANAVRVDDGRCRSALAVPHGRWLADRLPHVRVARAFTHVQDELLVSRATRQPGAWAVAVAADDAEAQDVAADVVRSAGYVPVVVGALDESAVLDAGGPLFLRMLLPGDLSDVVADWRRARR